MPAGCNGRAVQQAAANPDPWAEVANRFTQYINDLNSKALGAVQNINPINLNREFE